MGLDCCSSGGSAAVFSGAEAGNSTFTMNSADVESSVNFDLVIRDTGSYFNIGSDSLHAIVPVDGVYLLGFYADWLVTSVRSVEDIALLLPTINNITTHWYDSRPLVQHSVGPRLGQSIVKEHQLLAGSKVGVDLGLRSGGTAFTCTVVVGMWLSLRG